NHSACGRATAAEHFESYAGVHPCLSGDAALRRLDRCTAADRRERRIVERADNSAGASPARLAKVDGRDTDLWFVCSRVVVGGILHQLRRDARHLFCRSDSPRAGRSAVFVENDLKSIAAWPPDVRKGSAFPSAIRSGAKRLCLELEA